MREFVVQFAINHFENYPYFICTRKNQSFFSIHKKKKRKRKVK